MAPPRRRPLGPRPPFPPELVSEREREQAVEKDIREQQCLGRPLEENPYNVKMTFVETAPGPDDDTAPVRVEKISRDRMTDEQVARVAGYLKALKESDGTPIARLSDLSYHDFLHLSVFLCRWPRPSEVQRILAHVLDGRVSPKEIAATRIRTLSIPLALTDARGKALSGGIPRSVINGVAGYKGAFFDTLTEEHHLLYVYLSPEKRRIQMYGYECDPPSERDDALFAEAATRIQARIDVYNRAWAAPNGLARVAARFDQPVRCTPFKAAFAQINGPE